MYVRMLVCAITRYIEADVFSFSIRPLRKRSSLRRGPRCAATRVCILVAFTALTACAGTRGGPIPYDMENFGAPDRPVPLTLEDNYRIGPMDTLGITVFQVPDLSGDREVDLAGRISMPLIGDVRAIDLTTDELRAELAKRFGEKYLQSPDISVTVKSSTRRMVTVDGSVRMPGIFPVTGPMTLMQAVALARGTNDLANEHRVAIFRQINGERMAAAFDLISIRRGEAKDPEVYSSDIIIVDGSNIKAVQRELLSTLPFVNIFNRLGAF